MENLILESISDKLTSLDASIKKMSSESSETMYSLKEFRSMLIAIKTDLKATQTQLANFSNNPKTKSLENINPRKANTFFLSKALIPVLICLLTLVLLNFRLSAGLKEAERFEKSNRTFSNGTIPIKPTKQGMEKRNSPEKEFRTMTRKKIEVLPNSKVNYLQTTH